MGRSPLSLTQQEYKQTTFGLPPYTYMCTHSCLRVAHTHTLTYIQQEYKEGYVFAKASLEHAEVKAWVKEEGITGIPHLSIYSREGRGQQGAQSVKHAEGCRPSAKPQPVRPVGFLH
jgi:hypothetical protein